MAKRIIIHRDRSFTYRGREYRILGGGPGTPNAAYGYEIIDWATGKSVEDNFFTFADIRAYLAQIVENDWPLYE